MAIFLHKRVCRDGVFNADTRVRTRLHTPLLRTLPYPSSADFPVPKRWLESSKKNLTAPIFTHIVSSSRPLVR